MTKKRIFIKKDLTAVAQLISNEYDNVLLFLKVKIFKFAQYFHVWKRLKRHAFLQKAPDVVSFLH